MNPLTFGASPANDLLFRFLFRGLLTYNPDDETMEWSLATCDISNLSKVSCTIKNGVKWSDGTPIQWGDVIATMNAFRDKTQNAKMREFLGNVSIWTKNGAILFTTKEKNPLMLELLSYPIIRSDMIEQIQTSRFSTGNYITSGLFTFGETTQDSEYGFDRITLINNKSSNGQSAWLDKVHFKFFPDIWSLERSTDTLSVIIPPVKNERLTLSARFEGYDYTAYEFFGIFFQTDNLSKSLRNGLHWQIGTSFSGIINPNHKTVDSIFLGGKKILPTGNLGNFPDILRKSGYLRKDEILANIDITPTTVTWGIEYEHPSFFKNKSNSLILFADSASGGILLSGIVPKDADSVSINGYSLQEYRPGNTTFVYRVSKESTTLTGGKNDYTVSFGPSNFTGETLTIYYSEDSGSLAKYHEEVDASYLAKLNTPALLAERERQKTDLRKKVEVLDDRYYYNDTYEPFSLDVAYVVGQQSTEEYAHVIEQTLKNLSIIAHLIPLEAKDVEQIIQTGKKDYDILVAWVSTAGDVAGLGQLFASSEAGKWVNFSNIESKTLDNLFIELQSSTLSWSIEQTKEKIISLMQDESFFFPLSSPIHTFYVDRNLKWVRKISTFPGITTLYDILQYSSIKDTYILNTQEKWILWFFTWIFSTAL